MQKVEFIESYIKTDNNSDYQWNDNHGVLTRCKDCEKWMDHYDGWGECKHYRRTTHYDDYCSKAERKCKE